MQHFLENSPIETSLYAHKNYERIFTINQFD